MYKGTREFLRIRIITCALLIVSLKHSAWKFTAHFFLYRKNIESKMHITRISLTWRKLKDTRVSGHTRTTNLFGLRFSFYEFWEIAELRNSFWLPNVYLKELKHRFALSSQKKSLHNGMFKYLQLICSTFTFGEHRLFCYNETSGDHRISNLEVLQNSQKKWTFKVQNSIETYSKRKKWPGTCF